jgi:hypothetical protein
VLKEIAMTTSVIDLEREFLELAGGVRYERVVSVHARADMVSGALPGSIRDVTKRAAFVWQMSHL